MRLSCLIFMPLRECSSSGLCVFESRVAHLKKKNKNNSMVETTLPKALMNATQN